MRSARSKVLFLALFLGAILLAPRAFASDEQPPTDPLGRDLGEIKTRLATLEQGQKDILSKEDDILKELATVKIWVHRK